MNTRAERYNLCVSCQKSIFNRKFKKAEAQGFPAPIGGGDCLRPPRAFSVREWDWILRRSTQLIAPEGKTRE